MMAKARHVAEKIDAMVARERFLLFAAVVVGLVFIWLSLVLWPAQDKQVMQSERIEGLRKEVAALSDQIQGVADRAKRDPNRILRQRMEELDAQVAEVDRQLSAEASAFVHPSEMSAALRQILAHDEKLELVRIESMPSQPIAMTESGVQIVEELPEDENLPVVYRHGLAVEFVGGYLDTLAFLQRVEGMSWRFFWGELDYQVEVLPDARVRLVLYTLSGSRGWLGV